MSSYGKLSTAFYDLDKPVAPPDAVAYYLRRATLAGGLALEPMCGSGRFLIPLVQAGIAVEGVDASPDMLAACRSAANRLGLDPVLYEQSLESLSLSHRYNFAFLPAGSVGLIHQLGALKVCLQRLREHLHPKATLLVELDDVDADGEAPAQKGEREVDAGNGRRIVYSWRATRDPNTGLTRYDSLYQLREGEAVLADEPETIWLQTYPAAEFLSELREAGFTNERIVPGSEDFAWLRKSSCVLTECVAGG